MERIMWSTGARELDPEHPDNLAGTRRLSGRLAQLSRPSSRSSLLALPARLG